MHQMTKCLFEVGHKKETHYVFFFFHSDMKQLHLCRGIYEMTSIFVTHYTLAARR